MGIHLGIGLRGKRVGGGGNTYAATVGEVHRDYLIYDSGAQRGLSAADVPLSGATDAPDGTVIEARAVSLEDSGASTTAWVAVGIATSSAWTGTLSVPRAPSWYRVEVRVRGSSASAAQMTNRIGVGYIWAIWEQSNGSRLVTPQTPHSSGSALYDAITHEGDMQILSRASVDDGSGTNTLAPVPVTEAGKGSNPVSPTAVTMANAFSAAAPGEKLLLIFNTVQATHPKSALTTVAEANSGSYDPQSQADRDWDDDAQLTDSATVSGAKVGMVVVPGWIEAAIAFGVGLPELHYRLTTGLNLDGSSVTLGNSPADFDLPRLHDDAHGGKYDFSYTRMAYIGPHENTKRIAQVPPASGVFTLADLPGYWGDGDREYNSIEKNARDIYDSSVRSWVYDYPGVTHGGFRDSSDDVHFAGDDRDGRQRLGQIWMEHFLRLNGISATPEPRLNRRWDKPDGTYADFWIDGNNSLTTERLRRGAEFFGLPDLTRRSQRQHLVEFGD